MEISAETNSANGIQREMKAKKQKLGIVTSFKYLGAVVSDDGSKPEILLGIEQATAALYSRATLTANLDSCYSRLIDF